METVIGVEPTVAGLQPAAFPLGYTVNIVIKFELCCAPSDTEVLANFDVGREGIAWYTLCTGFR